MSTNESSNQENKLTNLTNGIANSLFGAPQEENAEEENENSQEEESENDEETNDDDENESEQKESEKGKLNDLSQGIANSLFGTTPSNNKDNNKKEDEDEEEEEEEEAKENNVSNPVEQTENTEEQKSVSNPVEQTENTEEQKSVSNQVEQTENTEEQKSVDQNDKEDNRVSFSAQETNSQQNELEQSNKNKVDLLLGEPKTQSEKQPEIREPEANKENSPRSPSRKSDTPDEIEVTEPENPAETPRRRNRLSQEELQDLVNNVISGQTPIKKVPPQQLPQLITALKNARDERISKRKADEAAVCDNYLLMARFQFNEYTKNNLHKEKEDELKRRIEIAERDYQDLKAQIDLDDAQQASIDENRVIELLDRQQDDDDKFRTLWRSDRKQRSYNRTSNQLRSLRTQTILLLNARRYDEMKQVDNMARKQEEIETRENYIQMTAEYTQSHMNLQNRHTGQMKTLIEAQETKAEQKKALNKFQMDVAQKRIYNLQKQYEDIKDPNKFWALYHRNDRPKAGTRKSQTRERFEQRNYATLQLPPLSGPKSARKMSRSTRYGQL